MERKKESARDKKIVHNGMCFRLLRDSLVNKVYNKHRKLDFLQIISSKVKSKKIKENLNKMI